MNRWTHTISLTLMFITAGLAFAFFGQVEARSVICGAGLMYLNFILLYSIGKKIFTAQETGEQAKGGVLLLFKLLGLFLAAYVCLTYLNLSSFWFALSASGMILTIAFLTAKQHSNKVDSDSKEPVDTVS